MYWIFFLSAAVVTSGVYYLGSKLSTPTEKQPPEPPAPSNPDTRPPSKEEARQSSDSPYSDPSNPPAISFPPAACISPQEPQLVSRECGNPLSLSQNLQDRNRTSERVPLRLSSVLVPATPSQQERTDTALNDSSAAFNVNTPLAHPVCPQEIDSAGDQGAQPSFDHHVIEVDSSSGNSSSTLVLTDTSPSTPSNEENGSQISISPSTPSQAHLNTIQKRTYSISNFDHLGSDSNDHLPQYEKLSKPHQFNPNNRISLKKDTSYLRRLEPDYRPPSTIGRKGTPMKNTLRSESKPFSNPPPAYFTG